MQKPWSMFGFDYFKPRKGFSAKLSRLNILIAVF